MLESTRLNNERITAPVRDQRPAGSPVGRCRRRGTKLGERNAKLTELNVLGERVIVATEKEDGEAQAAMAT